MANAIADKTLVMLSCLAKICDAVVLAHIFICRAYKRCSPNNLRDSRRRSFCRPLPFRHTDRNVPRRVHVLSGAALDWDTDQAYTFVLYSFLYLLT